MPAIPPSHTNYTHLLPSGDFNHDLIRVRAVEATRRWMNYQLRENLRPCDRRAYLPTLSANIKNEWDRAKMQRASFVMHQQIAQGTFRGIYA